MWAMALKEFRQMRRDRRTLALMIVLPLLFLFVFGYAASFDVSKVRTVVVGPLAHQVAGRLPGQLEVVETRADLGRDDAVKRLRDGRAVVAVVTAAPGPGQSPPPPQVLVDGADLFSARAVVTALGQRPELGRPQVLFNPDLKTSAIMVPGLVGVILVFVGTVITSLGVVRERQSGTLEQLAVMPFRPRQVLAGKIVPYFGVAAVDLTVILLLGMALFHVPFAGSPLVFAVGAVLFLFVTLGVGVLISTVSENQAQAIQLAMMSLLPQILLSGLIFPLAAMPAWVRWIGSVLPLTYFIQISRAVMVRGAPLHALWLQLSALAVLGVVVFSASVARFRRDLAPSGRGAAAAEAGAEPAAAASSPELRSGVR